jgi:hypothetical protein
MRWWVLALWLGWTATAVLPAAGGAQENCRWSSRLPPALGIAVDGLPRNGQSVRFVDATVIRPEPLFELGLLGVKKGDRIKIVCVGDNQWRIRHAATGLVIYFCIDPPRSEDDPS